MEAVNEFVRRHRNSGSGSRFGYGYGHGYGSGSGYGSSSGYGHGYGSGHGYGHGSCLYCVDISMFCGHPVYMIDNIATVLYHAHIGADLSVAKGAILHEDLTTTPCYVAKRDDTFAHGSDLRDAVQALNAKVIGCMEEEERIAAFIAEFGCDTSAIFPNQTFFDWHGILTGSCKPGREAFAKDRGIDVKNGKMSIKHFLCLTKNAYNGEVIKKLEKKLLKQQV